jgi:hypothetical protein
VTAHCKDENKEKQIIHQTAPVLGLDMRFGCHDSGSSVQRHRHTKR